MVANLRNNFRKQIIFTPDITLTYLDMNYSKIKKALFSA